MLCRRKGAVLKVLGVDDEGRLKTEDLESLITARTRLVAVTHISNVLGLTNPIKEIVNIMKYSAQLSLPSNRCTFLSSLSVNSLNVHLWGCNINFRNSLYIVIVLVILKLRILRSGIIHREN